MRSWALVGLLAFFGLPWYAQQAGDWYQVLGQVFGEGDAGNGLVQALAGGRWWLLGGLIGLVVATVALFRPPGRGQGSWLLIGGGLGFLWLLATGLLIGAQGWSYAALEARFGELAVNQFGVGPGGFLVAAALLMLAAAGLARLGYFKGDVFVASAVIGCGMLLLTFIAFPVGKALASAFYDADGQFSLAALSQRLTADRVWGLGCLGGGNCGVAWNTLLLALMTATGTMVLGTFLALLSERGASRPMRATLNVLALLPMITPPFVVGLGLILLFGRAGLVNQFLEWAFGVAPTRWFYGLGGIWLAQMFAFTPIAYLIMRGVVQAVAPSLEEAAQTLRANRRQAFFAVTLPLLKPGLANAFRVGFIESMADFGNPIIVGGQYAVLSTEIFFAIVGAQFDQGRAASLALVLTGFALFVFVLQRAVLGGKRYTTVGGKGDAGIPMAVPDGVRLTARLVALPWLGFTVVIYLFAFAGGFVRTWGRDYTVTLDHFRKAFGLAWSEHGLIWSGSGWASLFNTIELAALAAPLTAGVGLLIAWLLARTEFKGQGSFEFAALLAFAIPGTVLGVSYILAFNVPPLELTGTGLIIILCFMFRNLPVGVRAGKASFEQLDRSLDEASVMLGASTLQTLRRVVLPLLKPAIVAALVYSFVRAMTTVSAVIFLVSAEYDLATTYIIGRVGNGDYGLALAYCTVLIVILSLATALIQWLVGERRLGRRPSGAGPTAAAATAPALRT